MSFNIKIGIIGGSGLSNPEILTDAKEVSVTTVFGPPSDTLLEGKIEGVPCVLLPRHGRNHSIFPSAVNFRANLLALKQLGCTHVLVSTACGSLREEIEPGDFVIIDQFIDRTTKRASTFYDGSREEFKGILHVPMDTPFCTRTRDILKDASLSFNYKTHSKGTIVTIEGPRFSSKAESYMFRSWGGDVINMTTVPEVILARELSLCYAAIAMATDYDCWKEGDVVNVERVFAIMNFKRRTLIFIDRSNSEKAVNVLKKAVVEISKQDWKETLEKMKVIHYNLQRETLEISLKTQNHLLKRGRGATNKTTSYNENNKQ
ncbi:S-methyl-5'-thioadenosine phosphorylase [Armadillidium nasatum]|uniref:Purine nucleoside phosphorylase n=1 Tax=Armadillidium nasatum TaxID=96803 RepID=A0A5N5TEZ9_9CRUS|nr:S-methyl-5'-thioadenosine phosphorylase [Armadillidium nasatum]